MSEEKKKKRLDAAILQQRPDLSRNQVQNLIKEGGVTVNSKVITKTGHQVTEESSIDFTLESPKYVSRAGLKLEAALEHFKLDVTGLVALDAGISTGGFTDCLLQRGIKHVYGVEVGHGQTSETIKGDHRLTLLENTNLRDLEKLPEKVNLVTLDVSFTSVLKVMPAVVKLVTDQATIITLIKPQFEVERKDISRGGVVKDSSIHEQVQIKIQDGMNKLGFECVGIIDSPIIGATSGNKEFLGMFKKS